MTDRELMQQALEALEIVTADVKTTPSAYEAQRQAITALRERLAQQEQKPVPWESFFKRYCPWLEQPAPQPEQDVPVGWLESPDGVFRANPLYKIKFPSKLLSWQVPLYTTPPQRPWVDLTDEQIEAALLSVDPATKRLPPGMKAFAQAVGGALKKENT